LLISCKSGNPDISGIQMNIEIQRLDRDIFDSAVDSLRQKYGVFFDYYTNGILDIGIYRDSSFREYLELFKNNETVKNASEGVNKQYPDLEKLNAKFTAAFKYYRHYFPDKYIPKIYTYISGFNQNLILTDSVLAIGLDKYLGADYKLYNDKNSISTPFSIFDRWFLIQITDSKIQTYLKNSSHSVSILYDDLRIPKYLSRNMNGDKIVSDCISEWIKSEWILNLRKSNDLVSKMLYEGKILYATKMILPDEADSLVFGFSTEQIKWCENNESTMWRTLTSAKLLFSTDHFAIKKLTDPAPYTVEFTGDSPGKACNWIGYNIISRYMSRNPQINLHQMMNNEDYHKIFEQARYKP
jgi:hypothetical protein